MQCKICKGMMIRRRDYDHLVEGVLHQAYECPLCLLFREETTQDEKELKRFLLEEGSEEI